MSASTLIREARRRAGLTQASLAHRAGTSQPAVARYEAGTASPSVRTLDRLLHATGARLQLSAAPISSHINFSRPRMQQLRALRPELERIARKHGARNIRVFGSVARGEDRDNSDIDLLVDFDATEHGVLPLIGLRQEFTELLDENVDIATEDILRPEIIERVLAEAVAL